ncbi:hypothetical protein M9Y10_022213 [Tritrichomonas musculus]|uniref:Uncharacterized protein n=1 Tax=Tritrichomonas musculus TaxID=1915356 RepID=A0ABR2KRL7_9EUKA
MSIESSFVHKREPDEVLKSLFEQRKKWFLHSLSSAVESVTSDKFVYQMFQVQSSKVYIPDRICEIVIHSLSDDKEVFINQLLLFLSENGNFLDLKELERIGSQLLNLSTKQIQIEISQRNKIKELSTQHNEKQKLDKKKCEIILHKLTVLNTFVLSVGQEMRAFKRRLPYMLSKYQNKIKSNFSSYLSNHEKTINDLKFQNSKLISQSTKIEEIQIIEKQNNEEITKLRNCISKYQLKYQKLKNEKSKSELLNESYQKQLQSAKNELENIKAEKLNVQKEKINSQTEQTKAKEKRSFNDSFQSNELNSMKKQIKAYEEQIQQNQQKINQLKKIIQSHEEMTSKKFQNLIISQKTIKKLKDEFEKVSFVLNEIQKIDTCDDKKTKSNKKTQENEILEKIRFIKLKISSKNFESEIIQELKQKCQQLMLTKDKINANFGDEINANNLKEISILIEICTNITLQNELHEVLRQLNEKIEFSKINDDNNITITKLFRQLNKKTKENQRLSVINQKLQNQKDDLQQEIGDIKMYLRQNPSLSPLLPTTSRLIFSPSKSQNEITRTNIQHNFEATSTPKAFTKSEVQFQTFDESTSPIFRMNRKDIQNIRKSQSPQRFTFNNSYDNDEGDDEGENELNDKEIFQEKINNQSIKSEKTESKINGFSIIKNRNKTTSNSKIFSYENSDYNQNEDFTLIQTLSALFDMNEADEIPVKISNLMEKSEEFDHFQLTLCSALSINNDSNKGNQENSNFNRTNEIMVQIQKLKFENKKMKIREEKIKSLFNNQLPPSQLPNEVAKIVANQRIIQKMLRKENFDSYQELFENYYSTKKLNKAFIEREEMFRNYFPKYEFEKMPQLISVLILILYFKYF